PFPFSSPSSLFFFSFSLLPSFLRNKLGKAGDVILSDKKAQKGGRGRARVRLFNAVSVQKNKPEWSCHFVTMPKSKIDCQVAW
ncbi:MAG: hypothetical protein L3J11_05000, partial [Draconibacterium sp.]|nr:hypothetical protein [Draconibacterium sp.]